MSNAATATTVAPGDTNTEESMSKVTTVSQFWDLVERELTASVTSDPTSYMLASGESASSYARRVRLKLESDARDSLNAINLGTPTWKRVARNLGIAKFTQRALKELYASLDRKDPEA